MHSTRKEGSLEGIERWISHVDEAYPPTLCVLTNIVDPSDPEEQRVMERVPHFLSHLSIDSRLCFNICARTGEVEGEGQTAVVDACNKLLDRLIQKRMEGSTVSDDIISESFQLEPPDGVFMVTHTSEEGTNRVSLLQCGGSADADVQGVPVQSRCQRC